MELPINLPKSLIHNAQLHNVNIREAVTEALERATRLHEIAGREVYDVHEQADADGECALAHESLEGDLRYAIARARALLVMAGLDPEDVCRSVDVTTCPMTGHVIVDANPAVLHDAVSVIEKELINHDLDRRVALAVIRSVGELWAATAAVEPQDLRAVRREVHRIADLSAVYGARDLSIVVNALAYALTSAVHVTVVEVVDNSGLPNLN
ncbi:hypothetical protein [Bailinhaonella thermotolerans]|uniref:Uncharacterized protein n=1 Tax=Bailinhaonella thermotolerans TaxID=1070861 RepID=A0A3A3ZZG5_9ACTN|nr:hypothetical protein [Bailinhaonella thermotolerans]RJL21089.1 hypothetical protein D5H75_38405 [Bailinhaonella thermotolerans]